jgi:hypothetical protein
MLRSPSNAELLDAWDAGRIQHPIDGALTLLRAFTGGERRTLAQLSIGERDALLLEIRRRYFGDRLDAVCACERCGELNEFTIDSAQLPSRPATQGAVALVTGDRTIRARLPSSLDLAAVVDLDENEAVRVLTERCVEDGAPLEVEELRRLEQLMSDAETLAALEITFACSACGAEASAPFDAPAFLWSDVDERCRGLLLDVDALASAYGWSEGQILALADRRRAAYVQLARG